MSESDFSVPIPDQYALAVGHIVSAWSFLEAGLQVCVFEALRISPKKGRVVLRECGADELTGMLDGLFSHEGCYPVQFGKFKNGLRLLQAERNTLAHGIWTPAAAPLQRLWGVRSTKGTWEAGPYKGVSRKTRPESLFKTPRGMERTFDAIKRKVDLMVEIRHFCENLRGLPSTMAR